MAEWQLSYSLIPDGITTIVEVKLEGEFYVPTANANQEAEDGAVLLISRLTGLDKAAIYDQIQAGRWLGEGWRPTEK